jgi:hypothetical protein
MRLLRYLILFGRYRTPGEKDPPDPKDPKPESSPEEKDEPSGGLSEPKKLG